MKIKITRKSDEKRYHIIDLAKVSVMSQSYDADKEYNLFYFILNSGKCPSAAWDFNTEEYELEFFDRDEYGKPCLKKTTIDEIALAFAFES